MKVFTKEEVQKMAIENLNEDPDRRDADIKAIKDWMKKQPHLKDNGRNDDEFILMYLRGCKYSLEKVKKKIDMWHTVRTHCPDLFDGWSYKDAKMKELIHAGFNVPLKGYDKNGRKVIILRSAVADPNKMTMADNFKTSMMLNELAMKDPSKDFQAQVCGVVIIQDAHGVTLNHMRSFSPAIGKKATTVFQEAYPSNPKAMYFLGMPSFVETAFNMMKGFMKKDKLKNRIQVCPAGDFSKIQEELGKEVLPEEYGGTNGKLQDHIDALIVDVEKNASWLSKQYKYKSNEKKRPGKEILYSDLFGMEGSFRQLSVD